MERVVAVWVLLASWVKLTGGDVCASTAFSILGRAFGFAIGFEHGLTGFCFQCSGAWFFMFIAFIAVWLWFHWLIAFGTGNNFVLCFLKLLDFLTNFFNSFIFSGFTSSTTSLTTSAFVSSITSSFTSSICSGLTSFVNINYLHWWHIYLFTGKKPSKLYILFCRKY